MGTLTSRWFGSGRAPRFLRNVREEEEEMGLPGKIEIGVGFDLQGYYEDMKALRDSLTAQIESLEASGKVCQHTNLREQTPHVEVKGRMYAVCDGCSGWVSVEGRTPAKWSNL